MYCIWPGGEAPKRASEVQLVVLPAAYAVYVVVPPEFDVLRQVMLVPSQNLEGGTNRDGV